ncbi:MAG: response regulator transcription factor [Lysobacteraceae bacterium]|nr:MAG: response regulator transcription factor [Xanthomonadaceae bacterium]
MAPLGILLVDDHPIVRSGFRQLLELEPGWTVVAEVGSAQELAATLLTTSCDVLVLDLNLPDGDGMVMIRQLLAQRPKLAILVMSMHDGALYVQEALAAGARGYVSKRAAPDELIDAIRAIERGEQYLDRELRTRVAAAEDSGQYHALPELTEREAQIFLLLARGHSVARVAATIGISNKTAYAHRSSIYNKYKLGSDHELRELARRRGLVAAD